MESLQRRLAQLESAQLVRSLPDEEGMYAFKHTLSQEAAYGSLLLKNRRELHRAVAHSYEASYPNRLDEFAALLAQHYAEAGDDAKTLDYATRAGDQASRRYANAEAIMQYSRALEAARRTGAAGDQFAALYTQRGRAFELIGQYRQALANYDEMEALARARDDRSLELESLMLRAIIRSTPTEGFDPAQAQSLADRALRLARELGNAAAESKVLWILGLLNLFTARTPEAIRYGEESLAIARQYDLREQLAYTLNNLGYPYLASGQTDKALAVTIESRAMWREMDNRPMLAESLANQSEYEYALGEYDHSLEHTDQALRLSQEIGNLWGQSFSQFFAGHVRWERGEPDRAIQVIGDCIRLAEQAGFRVPQVMTRADLGWVYASLGSVETGLELVRLALASGETVPMFRSMPFATLARIRLLASDGPAAEEAIRSAYAGTRMDYVGKLFPNLSACFSFAEIELALAQNDHARATALADRLIRFLEGGHLRNFLPEARHLKAQALVRQGDREQAQAELDEARATAEAIGSRRMLWQILLALSEMEADRGRIQTAKSLRAQAREIATFIADHTPPEIRPGFLQLPKIKGLMQG